MVFLRCAIVKAGRPPAICTCTSISSVSTPWKATVLILATIAKPANVPVMIHFCREWLRLTSADRRSCDMKGRIRVRRS